MDGPELIYPSIAPNIGNISFIAVDTIVKSEDNVGTNENKEYFTQPTESSLKMTVTNNEPLEKVIKKRPRGLVLTQGNLYHIIMLHFLCFSR